MHSLRSVLLASCLLAVGCGDAPTTDAAVGTDAASVLDAFSPDDAPTPGADSPTPGGGAPSGDVARCQSIAAMVATSCEGQADRTCHHTETAALCATERADVLADALQCLLDASTGTGSCRTFGDPSGAQACLTALAGRTDTTSADPVFARVMAACATATEDSFLTMGAIPGMALGPATLARFDTCVTATTDCVGVATRVNDLYPALSACYD